MKLVPPTDPILRRKATPVDAQAVNRVQLRELFEIMERECGVGLAAPQVGWDARVFVMSSGVFDSPGGHSWAFLNPSLYLKGKRFHGKERCLSFPNLVKWVPRFAAVTVQGHFVWRDDDKLYSLMTGEFTFHGLAARVVQHEADHLDGITIGDVP